MPVVTIANTKGGAGKSTVSTNIAAELAKQNKQVCIIDADHQRSVFSWNSIRELMIEDGADIPRIPTYHADGQSLVELAADYSAEGKFVVIDSPGADNRNHRFTLLRADYIVTPCTNAPVELWALRNLFDNLETLGQKQLRDIPVFLLFNRIKANTSVTSSTEFLRDRLNFFVRPQNRVFETILNDRRIYQHAFGDGMSAAEAEPNGKAAAEVSALIDEFLTIIETKEVKQNEYA